MRKVFLCFIFSCISICVFAQQHKIDSLYSVLKNAKGDTNCVNVMNALALELNHASNFDAADSLSKKSLELAIKLNFKTGMAGAYRNIGSTNYNIHNTPEAIKNFLLGFKIDSALNNQWGLGMDYACIGLARYQQGNYEEASKNYEISIKIQEATNNKDYLFRTYQYIGLVSKKKGNYADALKYYLKSLTIAEERGNKHVAADDYMDIGNIYTEQNNDSDAMKSYKEALKDFELIGNKRGMGSAYCNIGNLFNNVHNSGEALSYYEKSLEIAKENDDKEGMTNAYGNIGTVEEELGNHEEALKNQNQSLKIDLEIGDKEGVSEDYLNIGSILLMQGKYAEAVNCQEKALTLAKELGSKLLLRSCYAARVSTDTAMGNYKQAYSDYYKYRIYRDSLMNEENTKKIVSEQMQYEFDKKQAEERAIQDKKDGEAAAADKRQQIVTISVSIGLLLVLLFSGLLFSRFRITQQQKKIIEEQKELVDEKNKEVLDSITYAKRLQDAILPPISIIKKYFPESFVLYKPKDIVAGDFYWMERAGDTILIAAADCTGHGVPGAMVSVVCSNALNRAVKEFKITEPGKILDKVRELVLETFSQRDAGERSESDVKDGMDISLLAISRQPLAISWSGAYNPLWYIENGEMKEIAGDKQPIGKTDNPKPFTTHTIIFPPNRGDKGGLLYLFTDGYADQFGGDKGKKFKYKQLQEKLLAISPEPIEKQKQELETVLEKWKGNLEQVDDILLIGVKV